MKEVEVNGTTYQIKRLSGYELHKIIASGEKDEADASRDMIVAAVIDPEISKEDVEELDGDTYFSLLKIINDLHEDDIKNLVEQLT